MKPLEDFFNPQASKQKSVPEPKEVLDPDEVPVMMLNDLLADLSIAGEEAK